MSSLLDEYEEDDPLKSTKDEVLGNYDVAKIKSRIEHVENLSKMNSIILKELKSRLKEIEK